MTFFLVGEIRTERYNLLLVSFHFDWDDNARRHHQIKQLIEYAKEYDFAVLMGDTNCHNYENGVLVNHTILYEEEWKMFRNEGYSMANNGRFGLFVTTAGNKPVDNIFVSSKIDISNAYTVNMDYMDDHYMMVADLLIKD